VIKLSTAVMLDSPILAVRGRDFGDGLRRRQAARRS
jgi:hypothetical protein